MTIQVGDRMPAGSLKTMTSEGIQDVSTDELFAGKKVVLFAVPGAFTPTCNDAHLPGFLVASDKIKAKGVDTIACLSVNDVFVMGAWGKATNADGLISMLADGSGDYTAALGLSFDLTAVGLGSRSKRYAAIVDDGVVKYLGVEPGKDVGVSSAAAVLEAL